MRVSLMSGVTTDETAEFKQSLPVNLEVVPVNNKISEAQFRATSGAIPFGMGPGLDRGGINWNGAMFRVMDSQLCQVSSSGAVTSLGSVGNDGKNVTLDFSFDRLGIRSGTNLFYYNSTIGLVQVTSPNLGPVIDMMWIDSYWMTTDGKNIVVTELNDPMTVKPLKYGAPDEDPAPVTGLTKLNDEAYVLQNERIQVFRNVGGNGFPFAAQKGASIQQGCVGPTAKCLFADTFAFVGSSRGEALGVYLAENGQASRISNRRIDDELAAVSDPTQIVLEDRTGRGERRLLIHLPTKTLCFFANATRELEQPVWSIFQSGVGNPYRLRNSVNVYGGTYVGDTQSSQIGQLTDTVSTHFGENEQWQFDVGALFNDGKGAILSSVELIGLPGRAAPGVVGTMSLSLTRDGENFSAERMLPMGLAGQRTLRMQWRPRVNVRTWLGMRFKGLTSVLPGFAACEIEADSLSV